MERNLFDYLKKNSSEFDNKILEFSKFRITEKIYYYGDHFKKTRKTPKIIFLLKSVVFAIYIVLENIRKRRNSNNIKGLSMAYNKADQIITNHGFDIDRTVNSIKRNCPTHFNLKLFWTSKKIEYYFTYKNFNVLISNKFFLIIDSFYKYLIEEIFRKDYKLLFVPNDSDFLFKNLYFSI